MEEDLETVEQKEYDVSCCRSYCTPQGRCYSCPEQDERDPDEE